MYKRQCDLVPGVGELSRDELAAACVTAENVVAGANTGGMDQAISLGAEDGRAMLLDCRDMSSRQVRWTLAAEGWELLVMDTRAPHRLVDGQYAERRSTCETAARTLGVRALRDVPVQGLHDALSRLDPLPQKRVRHIVTEIDRVASAADALEAGDAAGLGDLMSASHASMRDDYEISSDELDVAVETALAQGSPGARMTGGGFGGSAIALVSAGAAGTTAQAVVEAFAARGFAEPQFLVVTPSGPARRER